MLLPATSLFVPAVLSQASPALARCAVNPGHEIGIVRIGQAPKLEEFAAAMESGVGQT